MGFLCGLCVKAFSSKGKGFNTEVTEKTHENCGDANARQTGTETPLFLPERVQNISCY